MLTADDGIRLEQGGSWFTGQDLLRAASGSQEGVIRGMTWNVNGFLDKSLDFALRYMTADAARGRPSLDFACFQEPGLRWGKGKPRSKLWQSSADGTRSSDTGWRMAHTEFVVLIWSAWWDTRRIGPPTISADRRTISVTFSHRSGRFGLVGHYGVASPRSSCSGGRAVRPTGPVQDQCFSGICLGGVRQRPPRALLTTRFLGFNGLMATTLSVDFQHGGVDQDG